MGPVYSPESLQVAQGGRRGLTDRRWKEGEEGRNERDLSQLVGKVREGTGRGATGPGTWWPLQDGGGDGQLGSRTMRR